MNDTVYMSKAVDAWLGDPSQTDIWDAHILMLWQRGRIRVLEEALRDIAFNTNSSVPRGMLAGVHFEQAAKRCIAVAATALASEATS